MTNTVSSGQITFSPRDLPSTPLNRPVRLSESGHLCGPQPSIRSGGERRFHNAACVVHAQENRRAGAQSTTSVADATKEIHERPHRPDSGAAACRVREDCVILPGLSFPPHVVETINCTVSDARQACGERPARHAAGAVRRGSMAVWLRPGPTWDDASGDVSPERDE